MSDTISLRAQAVNHPAEAADAAIRRVAELEAEIEKLRAERAWQPIATAPRDGTFILVTGCNSSRLVIVAKWVQESAWEEFHNPGWLGYLGWNTWIAEPKYWMPLPEPPAP